MVGVKMREQHRLDIVRADTRSGKRRGDPTERIATEMAHPRIDEDRLPTGRFDQIGVQRDPRGLRAKAGRLKRAGLVRPDPGDEIEGALKVTVIQNGDGQIAKAPAQHAGERLHGIGHTLLRF